MPITLIISTSLKRLVCIETITAEVDVIGKISNCIKHIRHFQIVST